MHVIANFMADFTVRKVYFSNISKGTAFLLQGMFETDPVARDVTILNCNKTNCNVFVYATLACFSGIYCNCFKL